MNDSKIAAYLESSIQERFHFEGSNWKNFVVNNEIETLQLEMNDLVNMINSKEFYLCVDPSDPAKHLVMSKEFVEKFANNPYFDQPVSDTVFDEIMSSIDEEGKNLIEEMVDWNDSSMKVEFSVPIEIYCSWQGSYGNHDLHVEEFEFSRDVFDLIKKFQEEAKVECQNKIEKYTQLVDLLSRKYKVDNKELFVCLLQQ